MKGICITGLRISSCRAQKFDFRSRLHGPQLYQDPFLAGVPYKEEGTTEPEIKDLLLRLHEISRGSVIITSAKVDGKNAVAGYDAKLDKFFLIHFSLIPMRFPGTGDIFSAVFMGGVLHGKTMKDVCVVCHGYRTQNDRKEFRKRGNLLKEFRLNMSGGFGLMAKRPKIKITCIDRFGKMPLPQGTPSGRFLGF